MEQIKEVKNLQAELDRRDREEKRAVELMQEGRYAEALEVLKNI